MDDTRSPPPARRRESSRSRSRDRDERPRRSTREGDNYDSEPRTGERQHRRRTPSRSRSRSRSPGRQATAYRHRDTSMPPAAPPAAAHPPRSQGGPFNAPAEEAADFATRSVREHRVYVGNLSYEVRYKDLEQFMTDAGLEVAFTEILLTPNGMSKGCGIVEFTTKEDATRAITEFADKALLGRPIFIREDREEQARFGAPPSAGRMGAAGFGGAGFGGGMGGAPGGGGRQIYVGNLPFQANWQDLKDLFRPAGAIIRADIQMGPDGRPKGSGTVVYESVEDAQNAIAQFNGFDWFGRRLEVREDRFAFAPARGGFRGGMGMGFRGGMMGGFGGRGGFQGRGGFGGAPGGFGGGFGGGFQGGAPGGYQAGVGGGFGGAPAYGQQQALGGGDAFGHAGGAASYNPSKQILVNNLPWSTSNEDLVELFETTGEVVSAEILIDVNTGRSRGQGIVEFTSADQSTTAIAKFTGYMYGGRPLEVRYNARFHQFTPSAGRGGVAAEV